MIYIGLGIVLISTGFSLFSSSNGQLMGVSLPIVFGEYKNIAGMLFVLIGIWLMRSGIKALKAGKGL